MKTTKVISWRKWDTPIPKVGQIIENMFREKFKVIKVERKAGDFLDITLEVL